MESYYFINLIFIFAVNLVFFLSGICLNSLVILSFRRSVQLRKKLCYFMIMVLSCCDLLTVLTNNPLMALMAYRHAMVEGKGGWKC
jgi:membrane-anchored glycerophosphoryl diester phosphodiesterase (GDPDase)